MGSKGSFVILNSSSVDRLFQMWSHIWSKYTLLSQLWNTIQGCENCNTKSSFVCQACLHRHCLCSVRDWTSYLLCLQADRTKVTPTSILPSPFIYQYARYPYDFTVGTVVFLIFNLFGSLLSAPLTRSDKVYLGAFGRCPGQLNRRPCLSVSDLLISASLEHCRAVVDTCDKDKDIGSNLVTLLTHLTIPDKLRNSNHDIEG